METDVSDASNPFSLESNYLTLDPDLYDSDSDDVPDPGLLEENELSFSKLVPQLFLRSSWRKSTTPRARARQLWLLLRRSLHSFLEKEKRAQLRVARLTHGLEPLRRLEVAAGLCSVAQDPVGRRFVVLDRAGCLHLHREDGWVLGTLPAPVALTGLVAVLGPLGSMSRFVGWGPAGLAILKPDLSLLWLSEPRVGQPPRRQPICCLPVPDLGLLLVAEAGGGLALWKFRLGGRCLLPCGPSLQSQLSPTGALTRLALGPLSPNYVPRCFAAYGSAVLTFDLHTWTVIDVRQDLHKTTISDLAYCGEMEAMVTASRDSTVKVWGADWQIRMVFVGHTGPVTAIAVLPNTPLVLSASQDGTLRTWDLQAVAQVGEVMLSFWDQGARSESVNCLLAPASPGWPVLSVRAGSVELWCLRELYSPLTQLSAPVLHLQLAPELPLSTYLPARLVCACTDGSVYLVNPETGRTVSALLLGPEDCAEAVAYCLPREVLWLLTRAGHLVRANTACSPIRVLLRGSPLPPPAPRPCCLHLYSHLTDPSSAFTGWEAVCQHKGTCLWWGTRMAPCRCSTGTHWSPPSIQRRTARARSPPLHRPGTASCPPVSTPSRSPRAGSPFPAQRPSAGSAPPGRRGLDGEDVARVPLLGGEPEPAAHLLLLPPRPGAVRAREEHYGGLRGPQQRHLRAGAVWPAQQPALRPPAPGRPLGPRHWPVLLPHAQAVRLLQPGLHHPDLDLREPPAATPAAEQSTSGSDLLQQQWGPGAGPGLPPLRGIPQSLPAHDLPGEEAVPEGPRCAR